MEGFFFFERVLKKFWIGEFLVWWDCVSRGSWELTGRFRVGIIRVEGVVEELVVCVRVCMRVSMYVCVWVYSGR